MSTEVLTFGCRLNIYESELIKKHLSEAGGADDNVLVINSCAVTKEAERQLAQAIRKANRENSDTKIIVTGCAAQLHPEKYSQMPGVWRVLGNQEKLNPDSYKKLSQNTDTAKILVNDIMSVTETVPHLIDGFENNVRGFLQIQNGCNHRCTFCIIPYARGNSRSVPIKDIITQAKILVENGCREIVLTGVDITDYGKDLANQLTLGQAVRSLLDSVPELMRLRLSSLDVAEIDSDLIDLLAHNPRMMPNIHLSLQSGDDMILKRMKRRHSREGIISFYNTMKKLRPELTFGADVIAGFPTETDAMFQNTYDLLSALDIIFLHVFPYSERDDTPASRMPQIPKEVRKERGKMLRMLGQRKLDAHHAEQVGKMLHVLIEKNNVGRAEDFSQVYFSNPDVLSGKIVKATITHLNAKNIPVGTIDEVIA